MSTSSATCKWCCVTHLIGLEGGLNYNLKKKIFYLFSVVLHNWFRWIIYTVANECQIHRLVIRRWFTNSFVYWKEGTVKYVAKTKINFEFKIFTQNLQSNSTDDSSVIFMNASDLLKKELPKYNLLIEKVQDFHIKKDFMFATIKELNNTQLYISYKRGRFVKADFQTELEIKVWCSSSSVVVVETII